MTKAFDRIFTTLICVATVVLSGCGGGDSGDGAAIANLQKPSEQPVMKPAAAAAAAAAGDGTGVGALDAAAASFATLRGVVPPDPSGIEDGRGKVGLDDYVRDRKAAVRLGKALFWDMNIGSDGNTACASCHFAAGTDNRIKNQISPGLKNVDPELAKLFTKPLLSKSWGPNYTLTLADFPLHKLLDPDNRDSQIRSTSDDVISSQGVFNATFVQPGQSRFDDCIKRPDGIFHVGNLNTRRVEPRNTPTVINAAFNVRNFWDGRANNIFNGATPFGDRDPEAGIWVTTVPGGPASKVRISLADSSAASQAVGPPNSDFEMTCGGRSFAELAQRVLDTPALNRQAIDPSDSVLGGLAGAAKPKYRDLIQWAFQPRLWNGGEQVSVGGVLFKQIEANFPLFFGLAIQQYEATLISDEAPLDAYLQGNSGALNAAEVRGLQIFAGKGQCINCHKGPELTGAATLLRLAPRQRVERMVMGDGQVAAYDNGFYNIGVRATSEDLGAGGFDPFGNPLSFTRQYRGVLTGTGSPDPFTVDPCRFDVLVSSSLCSVPPSPDFRDAVDGAFKTPTLRNVALTGPYFHNGSSATLEQVVEFYNRGGNRRGNDAENTTGFGPNKSNLDADIKRLRMTLAEQSDLVAFLRNALTDPRVAWERAPFDHPSIVISDGHIGDETQVAGQQSSVPKVVGQARDVKLNIQAVGAGGRAAKDGPLQPFHTNLR